MAREMKDSGIAWIGEIPAEWGMGKIGFFADFYNGDRTSRYPQPSEFVDSGVPFINSTNINGDYLDTTDCKYITHEKYNSLSGAKLKTGDIVFCLRGSVGKCALNQHLTEGTVASSLATIRPTGIDEKYLLYCLLSDIADKQTDLSMNGTCAANLSAENVSKYVLPVPSRIEQHRIADFLDAECARIDAVIEKTRASIEEYKKLKQSVITQAVTKGIRPGRKMKDSGIEWIGEIPEEWAVRRIKTIFSLRDERNYLPLEEVNLISLYTDLGVVQHSDLEKITGNKASNADGYKIVHENDIIVNIILCWMGAIGRSAYSGVTSPAYDIYVPSDEIECRFYHHYFRTKGFSGDCYKRGKGIMAMRWRTYSDQFRDIHVVVPPIAEQREILNYLDSRTDEIEMLITKKERFLAEMESYKKSLIFEYVTGKKEVV